MGRILAIDYGRKRCGLAVTDPDQIFGSPLTTVATHELIPFLKKYIDEEDVECIVVGEPKQMNSSASEAEQFIIPFVKKLRNMFPKLRLERVDERFTSMMASKAILDSGAKKKDRQDKSLVDKVSAAIILQTYLEMR